MNGEVGRPTDLTSDVEKKIKECILDGKDLKSTAIFIFDSLDEFKNMEEVEREKEKANYIQKIYNWKFDNYLKICDKIEGWKRDRRIKLAEVNVDEFLILDTEDSNKLKVKADITKFVLETLDKDNYSKRSENTGKNGEPLILNINSVIADKNNINESTQEPDFNS